MEKASTYLYQFAAADYFIIVSYLLMLVGIGFLRRHLCAGVGDYFVGGHKIPWWMAGASCFMASFSAWTFTGAAGFAYKHGILIILIFYFNVIAYLFAAIFVAHRCRQTGQMTAAQIIFQRFGRLGEQFFLWLQVPNMLFGGAIWMLGLATFFFVAFGAPMSMTIITCGAVILIYSTLSGSWAVITNDFLQSVILMFLSFGIAILTLIHTGGIGAIAERVDPQLLTITSDEHTWLWIVAYGSMMFFGFNSIVGAPRFLSVRDGKAAKKAALMAAALFMIGPLVWFIPPIAASFLYPDIGSLLPDLNHPQDASYVLVGLQLLPHGLAALLVMCIFGATLSSMDGAINQNAGIITLNIYQPLLRPRASQRELFIASRVFNVLCGLGITSSALFLSSQKEFALFDLMVILSSVIGLPTAVPFFLMYWVKHTPRWSVVIAIILGATYSIVTFKMDASFAVRVFGTILVSGGAFLSTRAFWRNVPSETRVKIESFYVRMNRPVATTESSAVSEDEDASQVRIVGRLVILIGVMLLLLVFFPLDTRDRLITAVFGVFVLVAGILMNRAGKS